MTTKTSGHYEHYIQRRKELASVIERQIGVLESLGRGQANGAGPIETLKTVAGRVAKEDLKALIMGHFNSGKSTLINALFGAKILPAKMLPTTAVINEIRYGAESSKRIIVHPKPGRWKGGNLAFPIGINELEQYVTIDHKSGNRQSPSSPFSHVEIYWPLPLLANQIEIVDSVGLNDPDSHDRITLEYLPHADAIIYCMPCESACTRVDLDTIAMLRNMGYTSLIFVLTKFDRVKESALLNGSSEDREFVEVTTRQLEGLTDQGGRGIFFVDSQATLLARIKRDPAPMGETGFPEIERGLEEYLVQNRFRSKLVKAIVQVRATNNDAQSFIDNRIALANTSLKDLETRFERVQEPLTQLKQRGELIVGKVETGMQGVLRRVSDRARAFLIDCPAKVEGWVQDYSPSKTLSWKPWELKESVAALAEDYLGHVRKQLKIEATAWAAKELGPWLEKAISDIFKSVDAMTQDYAKALRKIRIELHFESATDGTEIAKGEDPSTATKLTGIIYGILSHDWITGGMATIFGVKGLLRGLATQCAAAILLAIVSMFTPIGWGAMLAAIIGSLVINVGWNYSAINAAVRAKVIDAVEKTLRDSSEQNKMVKGIEKQVAVKMTEVLDSMRRATRDDLNTVEAEVKKALEEKRADESKIAEETRCLEKLSGLNREVAKAIQTLEPEANV